LKAGSLVDPAPGWTVPPIDLHAVWPATRTDSPVRRAFLDFLLEEWAPQLV
jgi:DNA-binding transcriptional LysR family regulator